MEMIAFKKYDLPDFDIFEYQDDFSVKIWRPDKTSLVLGQSNHPETSLIVENVLRDQIPVYKRPSGGETVILTNNMLVVAVAFRVDSLQNPKIYFEKINHAIIVALESQGVEGLYQRGISDISIHQKKILGSSIYRTTQKMLYHAVLNLSEEIDTISKYISHPAKEPDYRQGRSHKEFVTSLSEAGYNLSYDILEQVINNSLKNGLE
jgi:lipoate-protein ligase A